MTHISMVIRRLVDILMQKYGVEDPTDPVAKYAHPTSGLPSSAGSLAVQSTVL